MLRVSIWPRSRSGSKAAEIIGTVRRLMTALHPKRSFREHQNSFKSLAMSTGPENCFFTSSAQVE